MFSLGGKKPKIEQEMDEVVTKSNTSKKSQKPLKLDHNYALEKINKDTKRSEWAQWASLCCIILLVIGSTIYYTIQYFDGNNYITTKQTKIETIEIPVVFMKYRRPTNNRDTFWWNASAVDWGWGSESLTEHYRVPTKYESNIDSVHVYYWSDEYDSYEDFYTTVEYIAITTPEYGNYYYLVLEEWDDSNLFFTLTINNFTITGNKRADYERITEEEHEYALYGWIMDRDYFFDKINDFEDYAGFNAQLVVNPAHYYDMLLDVGITKNQIKNRKSWRYDMSFNGLSGDYKLIQYINNADDNKTIQALSSVSLSPPDGGYVTKFVKDRIYSPFDVFSSIGGFYSSAGGILAAIFAWIIWGSGYKFIDGTFKRCIGICPYAEPDDYLHHRQTQNTIIKSKIIFEHKYENQPDDMKQLAPVKQNI